MGSSPSGVAGASALGLSVVNLEALQFVRESWELPSEIWVRVSNPLGHREVQVSHGNLVGGTSTISEDRLGILLASEGRYDVDLLEPMAKEAQARGVRFGELLVADGLLTPSELAEALERQTTTRLLRLLTMPGLVTIGAGAEAGEGGRPLGALVVDFFRNALELAALAPLLIELDSRRLRFTSTAAHLPKLGLLENELLEIVRDPVVQGRAPFELTALAEPRVRLICGLVGVGVLEQAR